MRLAFRLFIYRYIITVQRSEILYSLSQNILGLTAIYYRVSKNISVYKGLPYEITVFRKGEI